MNNNEKIRLNLDPDPYYHCIYCTFNLDGEFIFCNEIENKYNIHHKIIWIYSTQTNENEWMCKGIYEIPKDSELISISIYNKIYLFSNNNIYEWNFLTEKSIRIFFNEEVKKVIKLFV